ncbi:hypothetical protein BC835DRAFT_1372246 [Cytidiella melzeri]|nr:hypothetical protein BC835DRAFT_1372246 [Cytidiella melzeri]
MNQKTCHPLHRQQGEMEAGNEEAAETRLETRQLYRMYVKTTRNNIIITFTRPNGDPIRTHTGGACGFKHVNRSTHEAAHQCAVKMFKTIQEGILPKDPKMKLHVFVSGFGKGRDAVKQAFMGTEGDALRPLVVRLTDKTPIKIGGVRAKKVRRV